MLPQGPKGIVSVVSRFATQSTIPSGTAADFTLRSTVACLAGEIMTSEPGGAHTWQASESMTTSPGRCGGRGPPASQRARARRGCSCSTRTPCFPTSGRAGCSCSFPFITNKVSWQPFPVTTATPPECICDVSGRHSAHLRVPLKGVAPSQQRTRAIAPPHPAVQVITNSALTSDVKVQAVALCAS